MTGEARSVWTSGVQLNVGDPDITRAYPKTNWKIKIPVVPSDTAVAASYKVRWLDGVSVGDPGVTGRSHILNYKADRVAFIKL